MQLVVTVTRPHRLLLRQWSIFLHGSPQVIPQIECRKDAPGIVPRHVGTDIVRTARRLPQVKPLPPCRPSASVFAVQAGQTAKKAVDWDWDCPEKP